MQVAQRAGRVITDTARSGLVRANVNMFIPKAILIEPGSKVRWSNPSNLPHNVVGVFSQTTGSDDAKSTSIIADNPTNANGNSNKTNLKTAEVITIDSGFIEPSASWQHRFDRGVILNYPCTIHAEEDMRGTVIIRFFTIALITSTMISLSVYAIHKTFR